MPAHPKNGTEEAKLCKKPSPKKAQQAYLHKLIHIIRGQSFPL